MAEYEMEDENMEQETASTPARVTDEEQLLGTDTLDEVEVESFLKDTMTYYRNLLDLEDPYYGFSSLKDKWNEYDRCYYVQGKKQEKKNSKDYKGNSDVMFPDFHEKVETIRTREVNALFSGADQFITKPQRGSAEEQARVAKLLVEYNFNCVDLRTEVSLLDLDKLVYGTCQAYVPFCEEKVTSVEVIDYLVNPETGKPVMIDGVIQLTKPYKAKVTRTLKYTKLERLPIQHVLVNPQLRTVQEQEAVFIRLKKSYKDLLAMEEKGLLAEGKAEYIKDFAEGVNTSDQGAADRDSATSTDQQANNKEVQALEIYLTYFWWENPEDEDDRVLFEAMYLENGGLCGLRKYPKNEIPIIKGVHIQGRGYYGLGVGDEMYSVYMAKNTRLNQVIDKSTWEVLGGGLYDPQHLPPGFKGLVPGKWISVPGLAGMLQQKGAPILGVNEMLRDAKASAGLEVIDYLDQALQSGTGATQLLAGQPTESQIDKTVGGIQAVIGQSNERINTYLKDFEDQILKTYADVCYSNYQEYLDPEKDLEKMIDPIDLTYIDDQGQEKTVELTSALSGVDFVFQSTKRIVESEEEIGKFQRLLGILAQAYQVNPAVGELFIRMTDFSYMLKRIGMDLDIGDLDKIFPQQNYPQLVADLQGQLAQMTAQLQTQQMAIAATKAKLKDQPAALQTIGEVEKAFAESQAQQLA